MLEITGKVILLLGLAYVAKKDYRTGFIPLTALLLLLVGGVLLSCQSRGWKMVLGGMLVGGLILLLSVLTKESIGLGDGLLFVVTGAYVGIWSNLELVLLTLWGAGIFSVFSLVLKKKRRTDRVAMAPFVLVAYVIGML